MRSAPRVSSRLAPGVAFVSLLVGRPTDAAPAGAVTGQGSRGQSVMTADVWLRGDGTASGRQDAIDAFNFARSTYNFYNSTFGRDSYGADGNELEVFIHARIPDPQRDRGIPACVARPATRRTVLLPDLQFLARILRRGGTHSGRAAMRGWRSYTLIE